METEGVPVTQLMTSDLVTVRPDTPVTDAVSILLEEGIGSLVVVDDENSLAGVVTSTDLLEILSAGGSGDGETVGQYMTEEVVTADPHDSIQVAAARMITNRIEHLPVEDTDEGVVGMLSTTDITAYTVSHIRTGE